METRPESQDQSIVDEVMVKNEYQLPDIMIGQNIVDIGAHIGCFSVACLERGARSVTCYEPDVNNFELLKKNTRKFNDRASINHCGVWLSGEFSEVTFLKGPGGNTALGQLYPSKDVPFAGSMSLKTKTCGLDAIITDFNRLGLQIDLLKIDAEGSEYPIVYSSKLIRELKLIIIEIHDMPAFGARIGGTMFGYKNNMCSKKQLELFMHKSGFACSKIKNYENKTFVCRFERTN